ncbi:MAG TPA: hypothetical protein VGQ90_11735 [Stellaceae bacterium]|jgi:uncharacterized membrane protein|nr:hypothetical protein [Stellaceae bacterium]
MAKSSNRTAPRSSEALHPWVYRTIVGLVFILVLSAWGFFGPGDSGLALAVVTAFIVIAVAIPLLLWLIWRNNAARRERPADEVPFVAWQARDFEICGGRLKGRDAAVQVLLPIAAVAFGMALFALVLHLDVSS